MLATNHPGAAFFGEMFAIRDQAAVQAAGQNGVVFRIFTVTEVLAGQADMAAA